MWRFLPLIGLLQTGSFLFYISKAYGCFHRNLEDVGRKLREQNEKNASFCWVDVIVVNHASKFRPQFETLAC